MPQAFYRSANAIARTGMIVVGVAAVAFSYGLWVFFHSSYATGTDLRHEQPIPFSHQHHVGILGFDCRYCHAGVETSSFAGIPATDVCMNCHSQIWVGSEMLAPVRESYRSGTPLTWNRVHNLQGFAYFNHGIHVRKGVGCTTCHGPVDQMPLTYQANPVTLMSWCLECHRAPERFVRPREEVFNMQWKPPDDQVQQGRALVEKYHIRSVDVLTSCSICHR